MKPLYPSSKIYLAQAKVPKAGRGVFALCDISKDEVIEECPVVAIPENERKYLKQSLIKNYYFLWGKTLKDVAIALGFGSLYNHSYTPNATYIKKVSEQLIIFKALKPIKKGQEITVNYNQGNPHDKTRLWIKEIPAFRDLKMSA